MKSIRESAGTRVWFAIGSFFLFHALLVMPGQVRFSYLCAEQGTPVVEERVRVDTVFFDRLAGYEASELLKPSSALSPAPFTTIEFKDYSYGNKPTRATLGSKGNVVFSEIASSAGAVIAYTAKYGVNKRHVDFGLQNSGFVTSIYEVSSMKEIAKSSWIAFDGGALQFLRFTMGMKTCPDDSSTFQIDHWFPQHVLGGYEPIRRQKD